MLEMVKGFLIGLLAYLNPQLFLFVTVTSVLWDVEANPHHGLTISPWRMYPTSM